jgi:transposase-like protein
MAKRRRDESPERQVLREMDSGYLKENPVKNGADVNALMREMMTVILECSLDGEMDEGLGYSKYDFRNKETDNSRNGYSIKTLHTSYEDMERKDPRNCNGEFEPKVVKISEYLNS